MKKLCYIAFLIFLAVSTPKALAQGSKLFSYTKPIERSAEDVTLGASAVSIQKLRQERQNKRVDVVEINRNALLSNVILVNLPNGKTLSIAKTGESLVNGIKVWEGRSTGVEATLAVDGDIVSGVVTDQTTSYEIRFIRGRYHAIMEIDPRGFLPEHPPQYPSGAPDTKKQIPKSERPGADLGQNTEKVAAVAATGTPNVAVLVAYTPGAAAAVGSSLVTNIATAISRMNASFGNSGVNLTVNLAGTIAVPRDWATSSEALTGFSTLQSVRSARDANNADLVVLVGNFDDACGLAAGIMASPTTAFAVTTAWNGCYLTNFSLAHEIGHLMGGQHDIAHDGSSVAYPYAHGHQIRVAGISGGDTYFECVHTIMAYANTALCPTGDFRINRWSNPNLNYDVWYRSTEPGPITPHSIPTGVAGVANMAAVLNITGNIVEKFSETKIGSGAAMAIVNMFHIIFGYDGMQNEINN